MSLRVLSLVSVFALAGLVACAKPTAEKVTADAQLVAAVMDSILARPELRTQLFDKLSANEDAMKALVQYTSEHNETMDQLAQMLMADPNCKQTLMAKLSDDDEMMAMMQERMGKRMAKR